MELSTGKNFEVPDSGMFLGTIIDVIDRPNVQTQFGVKDKVLIMWVIGSTTGAPLVDSEGKPFRVVQSYNGTMNEKGSLFGIIKQILGVAPPLINSTEQLSQLLIGRSNQIFLTKEQDAKTPTKYYANVKGLTPLVQGQTPPVAPAGFVRHKDKPQTQAGPQGRPVQTFAQPPAQAAPAAPVAAAPAPAPTAPVATQAGPPAPPAPVPANNVTF